MRKFIWYAGIVLLFYSLSFAVEPPTICQFGLNSTPGVVALWHMNFDEDPIRDSSADNNTGALKAAGEPNFISGRIGGAYNFDSIDDWVDVANEGNFDFDWDDSFSFVFWLYQNGTNHARDVCSKIVTWTGYIVHIYKEGTGIDEHLRFYIVNSLVPSRIEMAAWAAGDMVPLQNAWHHFAMTYDGSGSYTGVKMYYDAVSQVVNAWDSGTETCTESILNNTPFEIGSAFIGTSARLNGALDEFIVINRELSAAEIEHIYYRNPRSQ